MCDVDQVPVLAGADAGLLPTDPGFYYDDFSQEVLTRCVGSKPTRAAFNTAYPLDGVVVRLLAEEILDTNGESDPARVCRTGGDGGQLGQRCLPPLESYDISQAILETRSAACGGDPCLVYHLEGSRAEDCAQRPVQACTPGDTTCVDRHPCATSEQLASHAFCSCRCDAPDPDAELCRCAKGFACVPLIHDGDPALVGSYCVRKGVTAFP